jgi:hypothetical protein
MQEAVLPNCGRFVERASGMAAVARDFCAVTCITAVLAAVLIFVVHHASAGWMGTLVDFGHAITASTFPANRVR